MNFWDSVILFLILTFILHAAAFAILALKRHKRAYFVLTVTFVFLTALYLVKFAGWDPPLPGTPWPLTWALRAGATLCTAAYLGLICREPGSWLWRPFHRKKTGGSRPSPRPPP